MGLKENAAALGIALAVDALLGDPEGWPHPVRFIGRWIAFAEGRLRARGGNLRRSAVLLTASTVLGTAALTAALTAAFARLHPLFGFAFRCLVFWQCISARCLFKEAKSVQLALGCSLDAARRRVSRIVGRDTDRLTREEVAAAAVESVAENTTDGIVAPMLAALFAGPAGAMAFKAASTLDSMVGYLDEQHRDIGWSSARLDDILCFLPARFCGALLCLSAALLGMDGRHALSVMLRDHANHLSPNCAWSEAAVAGALHVQLGGGHFYFGQWVGKPPIGDADRPIEPGDIGRACRLMYAATLLCMLFAALTALIAGG